MRRECWEDFPRHRVLAIQTCIKARVWRTCHDACWDHFLEVSFEVGGWEKRSQHSQRMRNSQFYVSGKRPIDDTSTTKQSTTKWCAYFMGHIVEHRPLYQTAFINIGVLGPLLLTWISFDTIAWIINHIPRKVWDEITYPFLNFNCHFEGKGYDI